MKLGNHDTNLAQAGIILASLSLMAMSQSFNLLPMLHERQAHGLAIWPLAAWSFLGAVIAQLLAIAAIALGSRDLSTARRNNQSPAFAGTAIALGVVAATAWATIALHWLLAIASL